LPTHLLPGADERRVGILLRAEDRDIDTYRRKRALLDMFEDWDSSLARVQAMMLSPTAADDITRFFTARPTEPAPAD
jgi:hypothetical protein